MNILDMFNPKACSLGGAGAIGWTWEEYFQNKKGRNDNIVLVDMINHPVEGSVPITNEIFDDKKYPQGTTFVLYCHSGGSSGFMQKRLTLQYPHFKFINLIGGINSYPAPLSQS